MQVREAFRSCRVVVVAGKLTHALCAPGLIVSAAKLVLQRPLTFAKPVVDDDEDGEPHDGIDGPVKPPAIPM